MSCLGLSKRVRSPSSATTVTATVNCTPRKACRASTTGCKTPGVHLLVEFLFETLQAFGVLVHRPDIFLEDDLLGRGGTDHFREPAQVGRAPGGPARIADIMPQQKRFEPELGGLEIPDGIFASPAQIADGFVFDRGEHRRG